MVVYLSFGIDFKNMKVKVYKKLNKVEYGEVWWKFEFVISLYVFYVIIDVGLFLIVE